MMGAYLFSWRASGPRFDPRHASRYTDSNHSIEVHEHDSSNKYVENKVGSIFNNDERHIF